MGYLDKRAFAGQVARAGESAVVALAYVTSKDGGVAKISKATDQIMGVSLKIGTKSENKPSEVMSVLSISYGSEVWVQGKENHGLAVGDTVQVEATAGADAGKVAKAATLAVTAAKDKFYVTEVSGDLVKLMRKE